MSSDSRGWGFFGKGPGPGPSEILPRIYSKDTVPACAVMTPTWALRSSQSGTGGHCLGGQGVLGAGTGGAQRKEILTTWGVREDLTEEVMCEP